MHREECFCNMHRMLLSSLRVFLFCCKAPLLVEGFQRDRFVYFQCFAFLFQCASRISKKLLFCKCCNEELFYPFNQKKVLNLNEPKITTLYNYIQSKTRFQIFAREAIKSHLDNFSANGETLSPSECHPTWCFREERAKKLYNSRASIIVVTLRDSFSYHFTPARRKARDYPAGRAFGQLLQNHQIPPSFQ